MTNKTTVVTHEQITRRAFELWCENGRRPGMAEEHWRAAERELKREREHTALSASQDAKDATDKADAAVEHGT